MHAENVDFHNGNLSSRFETQYEVQIAFRHEVSVVKNLILNSKTNDKRAHMESSVINDDKMNLIKVLPSLPGHLHFKCLDLR